MFRQYIGNSLATAQTIRAEFVPQWSTNSSAVPTNVSCSFYEPDGTAIDTIAGSYNSANHLLLCSRVFSNSSFPVDRNYFVRFTYLISGSTLPVNDQNVQLFFDVGKVQLQPTVRTEDLYLQFPELNNIQFTNTRPELLGYIERAWELLLDDLWLQMGGKTTQLINSGALKTPLLNRSIALIYESLQSFKEADVYTQRYIASLNGIFNSISFDTDDDGVEDSDTKGMYTLGRMIL